MEHRRREPAPDVFRLVLPLPFPGLKHVNAYLLRDPGGSTLVDCGMHDPGLPDAGWGDLVGALAACDVSPSDVARLVVTHHHIDHYGLAGRVLKETGCELWMHELADEGLDLYRDPQEEARRVRELFTRHGVSPDDLGELTAFEDWTGFVSSVVEANRWLVGGEDFVMGERTWKVVHTPGHARSHICLWEAGERVLISGDHLLGAITPHIDLRGGDDDPLGDYLASLEKVEDLDAALVLPGHGRPFDEGAKRARVIIGHHDRRLGSILQVIRREPHTASEISDEVFGSTLLNFERRLALGETLAHLAYLTRRGEIERVEGAGGTQAFRKVSRRASEDGNR